MKSRMVQALLIALLGIWGGDLHATESQLTPNAKLTPNARGAGDYFGTDVSIWDDYAIVGAPYTDATGENSGAAYIFNREGTAWTQQAKLTASDGRPEDRFGGSVSIWDDYAIVGASFTDPTGENSGAAYIFKRAGTAWTQQAKLTASDGEADDRFGGSVSISEDFAIVGAYRDDDQGSNSGSAYIFKRDGDIWSQQTKLTPSDGEEEGWFGGSVSISGDYAIVGVKYNDNKVNTDYRMAYIFKRDGGSWSQQQKLIRSDRAAYDSGFPVPVSVSGDYAIVGVYSDDDKGPLSGSAYIFKREGSSWTQQAKLTADDGEEEDNFGVSVSISGDYALIGAPYDDDLSSDSGAAYLFKWDGTTWTQQAKLTAEQLRPRSLSNTRARDYFGGSGSISGDYVLVGAADSDEAGYKSDSGAAYVFKIERPVSVESEVDTQVRLRPSRFALLQNHPNPFNPFTTIAYDLPRASYVVLSIYTITGQKIAVLVDGHQEAGHHTVLFDGSPLGTGVYLSRLQVEGFVKTRRMILLK